RPRPPGHPHLEHPVRARHHRRDRAALVSGASAEGGGAPRDGGGGSAEPSGQGGSAGSRGALGRLASKVPPPLYFLAAGTSSYVGSGLAVGLFASSTALAVGWARMGIAALILLAWRRPWRRWPRDRPWRALAWTALFGLALGGMNLLFYES